MKRFSRLWHSLVCGCHNEEHEQLWSGWIRFLWPLMTALSVGWFLVRVIPKPIRATYPCQQAAFPLLTSVVIWLVGLKSGIVTWLQLRKRSPRLRPVILGGGVVLVLGLAVWAADKFPQLVSPKPLGITYGSPSGDPPNSPMGVAKGIFPGRVTWMRDTNATPWDGKTGSWWQDTNGINQAAVDRMVSMSLRALTGTTNDAQAWDQTFKCYNSNHSRDSIGYMPGERVAIKINLNNCYSGPTDGNQADASKQTVLTLLRQLVNQAGVLQSNIAFYDAVRTIPDRIYQPCHLEFPSVQWFDVNGYNGQIVTWVTNSSSFSVANDCGGPLIVPSCVSQATYLINMPLLKGHGYSGVTLAGKNNYGSIPFRDHSRYLVTSLTNGPTYSMLVDLMGSRTLGEKTILYVNDGLFGNSAAGVWNSRAQCAFSNLFNGQWSASIFMSFDPVAIDSVCLDFLYGEFGVALGYEDDGYYQAGRNCDRYLHEAALADNPPSGTVYRPDGIRLGSLGVHEHWNNLTDKQYSRNLSTNGTGIELVAVHDLAAQLSLVSPTNGAVFLQGTNICLQVMPGMFTTLSRVDYFASGNLLGTSTNAPFGLTWTNPSAGTWALSANGIDSSGYGCTSAVVSVQVLGVTVAVTNPSLGAVFPEGTNITVGAAASSAFGSITQVVFYTNGSLLGATSSAAQRLVWSNVPAGSWRLSAMARDSTGLSGTSTAVNIAVLRDIRVALTVPSSGEVFPEGTNVTLCATAISPLTAISRVDFYDGGTWIGDASTSPYCVVITNLPPGGRSLSAVATETGGFSAASAVVNVIVKPDQPIAAGALYVDLRATHFLSNTTRWANQGGLGDCYAQYASALEYNVAGTAFPGVALTGAGVFVGPRTLPDIDGSSDRSVEVWALEPEFIVSSVTLFSSGYLDYNSSFSAAYGPDLTNGAFMQGYGDPSNSGWTTATNVPAPGVWHHLVYVYDGAARLNIYVDGRLSVARTLSTNLWTSQNTPIMIGAAACSWGYDKEFGGYINSVRVHGGVLSPGDVMANYLVGPVQWQGIGILSQPADLLVPEHGDGYLCVVPDGQVPCSYQWYRAGVLLEGQTLSVCVLTNLQWADSGSQFYCVVRPPYVCPSCTVTSRTATVTVQPQVPVFSNCFVVPQKKRFFMYFNAVIGDQYRVDYTEQLSPPAWTPLAPAQTAVSTTIEVMDFLTNHQRFYRVAHVP
jgi:hypothetical protein